MESDFYSQDRRGRWRHRADVVAERTQLRKRLPIFIGAGLAVIVLVGFGAFFLVSRNTSNSPQNVASRYCAAMVQQNYDSAYALFAPQFHNQVPVTAFAASDLTLDSQYGTVTRCTVAKTQQHGTTATVQATVTRHKGSTATETVSLSQNNGAWVLAQTPDGSLLPLTQVYQFCQSLQTPTFGNAFQLLSTQFQQSAGPASTFLSDAQSSVQLTGTIKGCRLQEVQMHGSSATVKFGIDFTRFTNMPAQIVTVYNTTKATWQVDQMNFTAAGLSLPFPLPITKIENVVGVLKTICSLAPPNQICTIISAIP